MLLFMINDGGVSIESSKQRPTLPLGFSIRIEDIRVHGMNH